MKDPRSIYLIRVNCVDEIHHEIIQEKIINLLESQVIDDVDDFYGEQEIPDLCERKFTICQMGDSIDKSAIEKEALSLCINLQIVFEMRKTPLRSNELMIIGSFEQKKWKTLHNLKHNVNLFHGILSKNCDVSNLMLYFHFTIF